MKANYSNYLALENWLNSEGIEFYKMNEHHFRILGPVALVDVWPARMTVHVIKTEAVDPNTYFRLDYEFNYKQLKAVLYGEEWR